MNLEQLRSLKPQILAIAEKYGVSNIRVFGSVARGDANAGSDVDFLIDMEKNRSLMDMAGFKGEIEDLVHRRIDMVKPSTLRHPLLKQSILDDVVPL